MPSLLKKISLLVVTSLIINLISPTLVGASPTSLVLITELQTGQGSSEFLEIENTSDSIIDLKTWKLQYHSSASTTWSTKTLTFLNPNITSFKSGDRALFLASGYLPPNTNPVGTFTSGLSDTGGYVRFVPSNLDETLGDKITWGTPDAPTCSIAPKHADLQSLKRYPSGDGAIVDSLASGKDFYVSNSPSPDTIDTQDPFSIDEVVNYCGKPVSNTTIDPTTPGAPENPGAAPPTIYQKIEVTELFPDPVTPQNDENDEYIELFNPNAEAVNLSGYKLQTGMNFTYSYLLGDITLQPGEYYAISRKDSKLTLSNTSSQARLLNPNGETVSQTDPYDQSEPAQSWQLNNGVWEWSGSPTPSAPNIQLALGTDVKASSKVSTKPAAKTAKAKKAAATKKSSTKKSTTTKASSSKKSPTSGTFTYTDDTGTTKLQPYILWGAGILLFGYGLWEYRWDLLAIAKRSNKKVV